MNKRILVELDALLDTRLGAMNKFSPSISKQLVADKGYYSRVIDDFDGYGAGTTAMWRNVYNQRDLDVLTRSVPTAMHVMLAETIRDIYAQAIDNPIWKGAEVTINVWPYELPEIDCMEICEATRMRIVPYDEDTEEYAYDVEFKWVSIPHDKLTTDEIREKWEIVVMYNFSDWFESQHKALLECERAASLAQLIVPALFKELPDRKSLRTTDGGHLNPFDETRRYLSLYFQLNFWDAQLFSMPNPFE